MDLNWYKSSIILLLKWECRLHMTEHQEVALGIKRKSLENRVRELQPRRGDNRLWRGKADPTLLL